MSLATHGKHQPDNVQIRNIADIFRRLSDRGQELLFSAPAFSASRKVLEQTDQSYALGNLF